MLLPVCLLIVVRLMEVGGDWLWVERRRSFSLLAGVPRSSIDRSFP